MEGRFTTHILPLAHKDIAHLFEQGMIFSSKKILK